MSNRTLIPALKARVGDWDYYICMMKYGAVAREVEFAHEMGHNTDLQDLIQRGITERTAEITEYLLKNEHRFLGALIVAAYGGDPQFTSVEMQDSDGLLAQLDDRFGVLTFDGSQRYFALDGQHRLTAIKEAIRKDPSIAHEDIAIILVSHYETKEGRERTRRLFTNINRNAKTTTKAENIALDEDDTYAIVARRLLQEHSFLSQPKRVVVFTKVSEGGVLRLAAGNVNKTDPHAWSTLGTLYEMLQELGFDLGHLVRDRAIRPSAEAIDEVYDVLTRRIDQLIKACGRVDERLDGTVNARTLRAPSPNEGDGHAFMRPAIQRAICRVIRQLVEQEKCSFDEACERLSALRWELKCPPWLAVAVVEDGGKVSMKTQRDYVDLLDHMLRLHIAPDSKADIQRGLRDFRRLMNRSYPVSEDQLCQFLPRNES